MDMPIFFLAKQKEGGGRHVCKTSDMLAKMCMYVWISTVFLAFFSPENKRKERVDDAFVFTCWIKWKNQNKIVDV